MNDFAKLIDTPTFQKFMIEITQKIPNKEYAKNIGLFIAIGYKKGIITNENFNNVINQLSRISSISDLPPDARDIFDIPSNDNSHPERVDEKLNSDMDEFHRRQYLFHELTHVVLDGELSNVENNLGNYFGLRINNQEDKLKLEFMTNGYLVLEEAIAQEVSENLVYASYNRPRPIPTRAVHEPDILPRTTFSTNWHYYGLYQPIGAAFSRTFRGIGCMQTTRFQTRDEVTMTAMCSRAFNGNFANQIHKEYEQDGQLIKLCNVLMNLGNVHMVKQASIGDRNGIELNESNIQRCETSYNNSYKMLLELENHRRPVPTNRDSMDF